MKILVRRRVTFDEILFLRENPQYLQRTNLTKEILEKAYLEYEEEGETDLELVEELPYRILLRIMHPKMVELIDLMKAERLNISQISRKLDRSVSNVYSDLKYLQKNKLVMFNKVGKNIIPVLLLREIRITFRS